MPLLARKLQTLGDTTELSTLCTCGTKLLCGLALTDPPSKNENDIAWIGLMEENQASLTKGLFSLNNPPPSAPKNVRIVASSSTLGQVHSNLASKMAELNMSPIEEPPPGTSPPLVSTGKSLLNTKLAKLKEVPPPQDMNPVITTTPVLVVASKIPDTTPASAKSPGFFQRTAQMTAHANNHIVGNPQGIFGLASKRSTSSKLKPARVMIFNKWTRPRIPSNVAFPPNIVPAHTIATNFQSSHDGAVPLLVPDDLETRLLSRPNSPTNPKPEPTPAPATESLEGISGISHTSSRGGSSSNTLPSDGFTSESLSSAPPDPRVIKGRQNDVSPEFWSSHLWLSSHTHNPLSLPADPNGTLASTKSQSSEESFVASQTNHRSALIAHRHLPDSDTCGSECQRAR